MIITLPVCFISALANFTVTRGQQLSHPDHSWYHSYHFKDVSMGVCSTICCSLYLKEERCKSFQFDFLTKTCSILNFDSTTPDVKITNNKFVIHYTMHKCGKILYTDEMRPNLTTDHGMFVSLLISDINKIFTSTLLSLLILTLQSFLFIRVQSYVYILFLYHSLHGLFKSTVSYLLHNQCHSLPHK